MIIEKIYHGDIIIRDYVHGILVKRKYIFYTEKQAVKMFKEYKKRYIKNMFRYINKAI